MGVEVREREDWTAQLLQDFNNCIVFAKELRFGVLNSNFIT